MSELALTLMAAGALAAAPVPAEPMPDPLGWGYLGVRTSGLNDLKFGSVEPGTGAERAGLKPGDEVVQIGTLRPKSFNELASYVSSFRPGTQLLVEVRRGSETKTLTVRLGSRPPDIGPPPVRERIPGFPRD